MAVVVSAVGRSSWTNEGNGLAKSGASSRLGRKSGLSRIADLLDQLREFGELSEPRPANFEYESRPFLHFHHRADGTIIADVRLSRRRFLAFDVSDEAGQQEVLGEIERYLASRGGRR